MKHAGRPGVSSDATRTRYLKMKGPCLVSFWYNYVFSYRFCKKILNVAFSRWKHIIFAVLSVDIIIQSVLKSNFWWATLHWSQTFIPIFVFMSTFIRKRTSARKAQCRPRQVLSKTGILCNYSLHYRLDTVIASLLSKLLYRSQLVVIWVG